MIIDGKRVRAVFILGAGATRGAVGHVLKNHKHIKAPLNSDFFAVAEAYADACGTNSKSARRLARLKRVFKKNFLIKWPPPMETAFSLLHAVKDFPDIYGPARGRKPKPGRSAELNDFRWLLYDILNDVGKNSGTETGYDRLACALGPGDTIVTLNYDTILDEALHRRGWDPSSGYGIEGAKGKFPWKALVGCPDQNAKGVSLLKLHGSLNWWLKSDGGDSTDAFSKKPAQVQRPMRNGKRGMVRQVIPPIFGKFFAHGHWRRLWYKAYEDIVKSDVLVVVGCSIVGSDFHLQALLSKAVRERCENGRRWERAVLVDRVKPRKRWKSVLKGGVKDYQTYTDFEGFLKKGLNV